MRRDVIFFVNGVPGNLLVHREDFFSAAVGADVVDQLRKLGTGTVTIAGQRVRWSRPGLVEEYSVSLDGVRQDSLVTERPTGEGELHVGLAVAGARVEAVPGGARLVLEPSGRKIGNSRLRATDATGRELPARIQLFTSNSESNKQKAGMAVVVDDSGARNCQVGRERLVNPGLRNGNQLSLRVCAGGLGLRLALSSGFVSPQPVLRGVQQMVRLFTQRIQTTQWSPNLQDWLKRSNQSVKSWILIAIPWPQRQSH